MRVRLIKRKPIEEFTARNARSRSSFSVWLTMISHADWKEPGDIVKTFGAADLLGHGSDRVIFDVAGNNFRMICKYHFGETKVHLYIKWIGTHAEYTKLCNNSKQFDVNNY